MRFTEQEERERQHRGTVGTEDSNGETLEMQTTRGSYSVNLAKKTS